MVNDPQADYSGDLGEGKDGYKPRLEPCWSMQLKTHEVQYGTNDPSSFTNPNLGPGTDSGL